VVWQRLSIHEDALGRDATEHSNDSLLRWCQECSGHVHELQMLITKEANCSEVRMQYCSTALPALC
jgi:hypothetical protein